MRSLARGYIASGEFNGNRTPQHLQNQIIKLYCDTNNFEFVLSRAEYWIDGSTNCQLWAALKEGVENIVFFSLWQLSDRRSDRAEIYQHCLENNIVLHFATEQIRTELNKSYFIGLEVLIESNLVIAKDMNYHDYLTRLKALV